MQLWFKSDSKVSSTCLQTVGKRSMHCNQACELSAMFLWSRQHEDLQRKRMWRGRWKKLRWQRGMKGWMDESCAFFSSTLVSVGQWMSFNSKTLVSSCFHWWKALSLLPFLKSLISSLVLLVLRDKPLTEQHVARRWTFSLRTVYCDLRPSLSYHPHTWWWCSYCGQGQQEGAPNVVLTTCVQY